LGTKLFGEFGSGNANNSLEMGYLKERNAKNSLYPQMTVNGQASWQSDVTQVTLPIPNLTLPEIPHDQYKIYLDVNQTLYDGGISGSRSRIEALTASSDSVQVMVDARKIKETVIDLYYNVIYFRKAQEVAEAQLLRLNKRLESMKSSTINGVLSGNDYLLFNAEVKKAEQGLEDLKMNELSVLQSLSILIGQDLLPETTFELPVQSTTLSTEVMRPEFTLFGMQKDLFTLSQNLSGRTLRPRLSAFAQGGYGRPALNMFSTTFDSYLMAGVRFNWNFYDWGQAKRDKQIFEIRKKTVENMEGNLRQNMKSTASIGS
jgi:outer membrane protein TolC